MFFVYLLHTVYQNDFHSNSKRSYGYVSLLAMMSEIRSTMVRQLSQVSCLGIKHEIILIPHKKEDFFLK